MWALLFKQYWRVSIFKESPANTPYSSILLGGLAVFFFLLVLVQWTITDVEHAYTIETSLLACASLLISYALYTYVLLFLSHQTPRNVQTLTCLLAGHAIVHVFAFPLLFLIPWITETKAIEPLALLISMIYLILTLILTVWQFMVTVHIYKHALSVDYMPAVLASFGLLACNILFVSFWR